MTEPLTDARLAEIEEIARNNHAVQSVSVVVSSWLISMVREIRDGRAEIEAIAARAREIAGHYPQSSDGRNTFILFAEWIEDRRARALLEKNDG